MFSLKQIIKQKLLLSPSGKPYKSKNTLARLVQKHFTLKKTGLTVSYNLTEKDLEKLQALINKNKGIWNKLTSTSGKKNTSS